ncbi:hypothetical protein [Nonomuraea lactucae]|nr:hypothetical protein [Nonomuraea lactucae]
MNRTPTTPDKPDTPDEHEPREYCWICAEDGHTAGNGCAIREGLWP